MEWGRVGIERNARWVQTANVVVGMLAILALVVDSAARVPGTSLLSPVAHGVFDLSASPSPSARPRQIPPLRQEFVRSELGQPAQESGLTPPTTTGTTQPPSESRPPGEGRTTPTTRGGLAPVFAAGDWDLRIGMSANRKTVSTSEDIIYAITVRNVGAAPFRAADLQVQWHVPFGTVSSQPLPCTLPPLPDLSALCALLEIPLPGLPDQYENHVTAHYPNINIPAGGALVRTFTATVTSATPGTELLNHAHFRVLGAGVTGDSNVVSVAVEVPTVPTGGR